MFLPDDIFAGSATHNPDRPNDIHRPHGFGRWLIEYTVSGSASISLPKGYYKTQPHDLFCFHPQTPQFYTVDENIGYWEHDWVAFILGDQPPGVEQWQELSPGLYLYQVSEPEIRTRIVTLIRDIFARELNHRKNRDELKTNFLEQIFLWCQQDKDAYRHKDPRIRNALNIISEDYANPLDIAHLANATGLSPSRFAHLFKDIAGESPMAYLEHWRIEKARIQLLSTTKPINQIALECGFPDPYHFSRVFKKIAGTSPSHFRRGV